MAQATNYLENELGNHVLRNIAYASPVVLTLSLHTSSPGESGSVANEVAGGGYVRQTITFDPPSPAGVFLNAADVEFLNMPGVTVTDWMIHDDSVGDPGIIIGSFSASVTTLAGQTFRIKAGDLEVDFQ